MSRPLGFVTGRFGASSRLPASSLEPRTPPVLAILAGGTARTVLHDVLEELGWHLEVVADSRAAARSRILEQTAIIVYDKGLNEPDWRERVAAYARLPLRPYVILLSPVRDQVLLEEVLRCGGAEVIRCPLDAAKFKRAALAGWMLWRNQRHLQP